ncbi:effector-associated constant component EACC1 [Streptomyces flaveolus]|uniref:effector-associated constant component EACC1 n=1 Tax=Streptomyces flaveolus TaxID=67297 RepID=UPI0034108934
MTTVQATVAVAKDAETELRSLARWLAADEETGRYAHGVLASAGPPDPEHMGTVLDVLSLSLGSGLAAGQLALAIAQWRTARRGAPLVTLHRNGMRVEIRDADAETVRLLTEMLTDDQDDDAGAA